MSRLSVAPSDKAYCPGKIKVCWRSLSLKSLAVGNVIEGSLGLFSWCCLDKVIDINRFSCAEEIGMVVTCGCPNAWRQHGTADGLEGKKG